MSPAPSRWQPDHCVPLTPRPADPPLQHPRNAASEIKTLRNNPSAMTRWKLERHLKVHPHRPSPDLLAGGDALTAVGANPAQRHTLLLGVDSYRSSVGEARLFAAKLLVCTTCEPTPATLGGASRVAERAGHHERPILQMAHRSLLNSLTYTVVFRDQ